MKTKTIAKEFYVSDEAIDAFKICDLKAYIAFATTEDTVRYKNKVTVSFEVPVKEKLINENDIDHKLLNENWFTKDQCELIKLKLFGE